MPVNLNQTDTSTTLAQACSAIAVSGGGARAASPTGTLGSGAVSTNNQNSGTHNAKIGFEWTPDSGTTWGAGTWTIRLNVTTGNNNLQIQNIYVCRVNSSGVNQATIGSLTSQNVTASAGVKTFNVTGAAQTPSAGDQVRIVLTVQNSSGVMNQSFSWTANQVIDTPFSPAAQNVTGSNRASTLQFFTPTAQVTQFVTADRVNSGSALHIPTLAQVTTSTLTIELRNGADGSLVATREVTPSSSLTTTEITLTSGERGDVLDWANLEVWLIADGDTQIDVSWVELETPAPIAGQNIAGVSISSTLLVRTAHGVTVPFPSTPVLDAFNRANGALSGYWVTGAWWDNNIPVISSNILVGSLTFDNEGAQWIGTTFGPNAEIYVDVPTLPEGDVSSFWIELLENRLDVDATPDGYGLRIQNTTYALFRIDAGVVTELASGGHFIINGGSIGLRIVNGVIELWRKSTSIADWARSAIVFSSDHTGPFYLSLGFANSESAVCTLDNVGGGTYGISTVLTELITSTGALHAPVATAGESFVTTVLITSTAAVVAPVLTYAVTGHTVASTVTIHEPSPSYEVSLTSAVIASTVTYAAPTVAPQAVTVVGAFISSTVTSFTPVIAVGAFTVEGSTIASASALLLPSVTTLAFVTGVDISSTVALYAQSLAALIEGSTISSTVTPYEPAVALTILAAHRTNTVTLHAPEATAGAASVTGQFVTSTVDARPPTVAPGFVSVTGAHSASTTVLFAPTALAVSFVETVHLTSTLTFETPTVLSTVAVTGAFISSGAALYEPSTTVGAISVTTAFRNSTLTVAAPVVSTGAIVVSGEFISSTSALYAMSTLALYTIEGSTIAATSTTFALSLVHHIDVSTVSSTVTLFVVTTIPGAVTVEGAYRVSTVALNTPIVSTGATIIEATHLNSTIAVHALTLTYQVTASTVSSTAALHPVIITAVTFLTNSTIAATTVFYAPTFTATLAASTIESGHLLFNIIVVPGAIEVISQAITSTAALYVISLTTEGGVVLPAIDSTTNIFIPIVVSEQFVNAAHILTTTLFVPSLTYIVDAPTVSTTETLNVPFIAYIIQLPVITGQTLLHTPVATTITFVTGPTHTEVIDIYAPVLAHVIHAAFISSTIEAQAPSAFEYTVAGSTINQIEQLFAPEITTIISIVGEFISSTIQYFDLSFAYGIEGVFKASTVEVYTPALTYEQLITFSFLVNEIIIYAPTITGGAEFREVLEFILSIQREVSILGVVTREWSFAAEISRETTIPAILDTSLSTSVKIVRELSFTLERD